MTEHTITAQTKSFGQVAFKIVINAFGTSATATIDNHRIVGVFAVDDDGHPVVRVKPDYMKALTGRATGGQFALDADPMPIIAAIKAERAVAEAARIAELATTPIETIALQKFDGHVSVDCDKLMEDHPIIADINGRLEIGTIGVRVADQIEGSYLRSRTDDWRMTRYNPMPIDELLAIIAELLTIPIDDRIEAINEIKLALHTISPLKDEPVDCVLWVRSDTIAANDYNPNTVAPPEMRLLQRSIEADGYTQPIVTYLEPDGSRIVVDGFHRHRVGCESKSVRKRIQGYLPVTTVNADRIDRGDRIASTIRHNRARGKHGVEAMSDIVLELSRRNWSSEKIGKDLGMDPDEVLRLKQITGLAEMFKDREFSEAWEISQ